MPEKYRPFGIFGPEWNNEKEYATQKRAYVLRATATGETQKRAEERWAQACRETARIAANAYFKHQKEERDKKTARRKESSRQRIKRELRRGI
jgi:hypothetical protein